jgi:hypothetical protein
MTGKELRHRIANIIAGTLLMLFFMVTLAIVEYYR